jgi:hypothetical protein
MAKAHRKATATRTVNPLHFEDIEPHRFEDLIRQLAHSFRRWGRLEATGRLGKDEGTDIRGIEFVLPDNARREQQDDEEDFEEVTQPVLETREWRIQCKRYKVISQKLIREVVREAVPDAANPPYGLIIAAACDVSAATMAAFHDERIRQGIAEGHLWTKAHLEDMLFLPENDHLLFAYFGLSLGTRQRSKLQQIQTTLAIKRKLLRAFKKDSINNLHFDDLLIRDIGDETYPNLVSAEDETILTILPWFTAEILYSYTWGLIIVRHGMDGWVKEDGTWDVLPFSASAKSGIGHDYYWQLKTEEDHIKDSEKRERVQAVYDKVPEKERVHVRAFRYLPFTSILEVDPIGDNLHPGVHLFCRYKGEYGPFDKRGLHFLYYKHNTPIVPDHDDHQPLFDTLIESCIKDGTLNSDNVKGIKSITRRG